MNGTKVKFLPEKAAKEKRRNHLIASNKCNQVAAIGISNSPAFCSTALHCTSLHCIALHCTVQFAVQIEWRKCIALAATTTTTLQRNGAQLGL